MSLKHSVGDIVVIKKGMKEGEEFRSEGGEEVHAGRLEHYGGRRAKIVRITPTGSYKAEMVELVEDSDGIKWTLTDEMIDDSSDAKKDRIDAIIDMM